MNLDRNWFQQWFQVVNLMLTLSIERILKGNVGKLAFHNQTARIFGSVLEYPNHHDHFLHISALTLTH